MYQHHQGPRSGGALAGPLSGAVSLYDYSGLAMEMGAAVPLYDYSGIGMDLGGLGMELSGIVDQAKDMFDNLSPLLKVLVGGALAFGVYKVATGKIKIPGFKRKARRNGRSRRRGAKGRYAAPRSNGARRRRKTRKSARRNSYAAKPRTNRRRRSTRRRSR